MQSALVSIHDVMPATLDKVERLLIKVGSYGIKKVTLLVVPGREWQPTDLDRLRRWHDAGYQLAGHGWLHRCGQIRDWLHRLHSQLISRDVAEHLSAPPDQCLQIVLRCGEWFREHRLPQPLLYVPPAWALGNMSLETLRRMPFQMFESQTGVIDAERGLAYRLPLVGYEADTPVREFALRCINGLNSAISSWTDRPLRLALHPHDLDLRLRHLVDRDLPRVQHAIDYSELRARFAGKNDSNRRVKTVAISAFGGPHRSIRHR